jgi:DNA polymerase III delta prime subunit
MVDHFYDQDLNRVQKQAVADIVSPGHKIPYLISGPPGTGKTKTIVEAALQVIRNDPNAKILLTAPSNAAADTLVRRLKAHLLPNQMFRLNSEKRTFAEVPQTILPYCFIEHDKFALPKIETLMKYQIVVTTCVDAAILSKAKVTNVSIQQARDHYEEVLNFRTATVIPSLFWTHLLIDEAAQASEPETLVAVEVVLPLYREIRPTFVLCGDRRQCKSLSHHNLELC